MPSALALELEAVARPAPRERELDADELREELAARAGLCRLLAGVFAEEPGAGFIAALRAPDALAALVEAGAAFDADFTDAPGAALADALACEYTTLFVASGGFPPVESVRLTGRYYQAPLFAVREAYRRAGFAVQKGRFAAFEDQLGVELAFAAELLERCAAALERGDEGLRKRTERELKRFWSLHLGRWVRGYARLVARAAEHSFYREMARMLEAFAEHELAALGVRVDDLDGSREIVPKTEPEVAFNPDDPVCGACPGAASS